MMAYNYLEGDEITASQMFDFGATVLLTDITITNPFALAGFAVSGILDAAGAFDGIKSSLGGDEVIFKR